MRPPTWCFRLLLVLAASLAVGCRAVDNPGGNVPGSPTVEETRSKVLQLSQYDDLPPPPPGMTFSTLRNNTYSFSRGGVRVARFRYWGSPTVGDVVDHYREAMPLHAYGWTLANEQALADSTELVFRKGAERCELAVRREDGATVLTIHVTSEEQKR